MQDLPVQRKVGYDPLQPPVLFVKAAQLTKLLHPEPRILLLPHVERSLADAQLAANIACLLPALILLERRDNLLFRVLLLRHVDSSWLFPQKASTAKFLQPQLVKILGSASR